jgi:hypothetical protein
MAVFANKSTDIFYFIDEFFLDLRSLFESTFWQQAQEKVLDELQRSDHFNGCIPVGRVKVHDALLSPLCLKAYRKTSTAKRCPRIASSN